MTPCLSQRDEEILVALVQKVRLFSLRQTATHWWNGEVANARRRLRQLIEADLIERIEVQARGLPSLDRPLISWRPGNETPDCEAAAYQFHRRWDSLAVRTCTVFVCTEHAARLYGGLRRGMLHRPLQATHDLGVAQVWLHLSTQAPAWATAWCGEDLMANTRRGEKCPDAFVLDAGGRVACVIEFAGQYHADRIRSFHDDCVQRNLPYQMW